MAVPTTPTTTDFLRRDHDEEKSSLLTCSFNQDGGCLVIGTTTGFSVHDVSPRHALRIDRKLQGGIGVAELLFRSNVIAIVGGGTCPYSPPHKALIYDDTVSKEVGEISFRQVVLRVRLRKDSVAVALRDRVYVYHLGDLSLRDKIYTADNPHGILALSTQIQDMVLACPSVTEGHVRVELYGLRKTVLIEAHESPLRMIALSSDGSKLATASIKGTVIRLWDVASASRLYEFRRGVERANISCLALSWDCKWLACTSDKGTAHVFQIGGDSDQNEPRPSAASTSGSTTASSVASAIFSSVRKSIEGDARKSISQIRGVPHPQACAFVADDARQKLAVAGWDADGNGVLMVSEFHVGEEPERVAYHVVCKSAVHDESEEARRRRRLRGWTPEVPVTPEGGRLIIGERLEVLEKGMAAIQFEETDEFVSVTAKKPAAKNGGDEASKEE